MSKLMGMDVAKEMHIATMQGVNLKYKTLYVTISKKNIFPQI